MDHHPGSAVVKNVQAALESGKEVNVHVLGIEGSIRVTAIGTDGPFARLTGVNSEYSIRLDHLIGYHVPRADRGYDLSKLIE